MNNPTKQSVSSDSEFLNWLADRLVHIYKEPNNIDFVLALRRIASAQPTNSDDVRDAALEEVAQVIDKMGSLVSHIAELIRAMKSTSALSTSAKRKPTQKEFIESLQKGKLYVCKHKGTVEYVGVDHYCGEMTYEFKSHTYGGRCYYKPDSLSSYFDIKPTSAQGGDK